MVLDLSRQEDTVWLLRYGAFLTDRFDGDEPAVETYIEEVAEQLERFVDDATLAVLGLLPDYEETARN